MAFNFSTDLRIEFRLPVAGDFVLGFSNLGGTDILGSGSASGTWQDFTSGFTSIAIDRSIGFSIIPFTTPQTGQAEITYVGAALNPLLTNKIHPGVPVQISYKDAGSTWRFLFSGFVDVINVSINDQRQMVMTFSLSDSLRKILNTRIDSYTPPLSGLGVIQVGLQKAFEQFDYYNSGLNNPVITSPSFPLAYDASTFTDLPLQTSEFIQRGIDMEQNYIYQKPDGSIFIGRYSWDAAVPSYWFTDGTLVDSTYFKYSDLEFSYSSYESPNYVRASLASNPSTYYEAKQQDNIDLYGPNYYEFTVYLANTLPTDLTDWGNLIGLKPSSLVPSQITLPALSQDTKNVGNFVRADLIDGIGIKNSTSGTTYSGNFNIVGIKHEISPDVWNVSYDLYANRS